jgi:hypothetical protein
VAVAFHVEVAKMLKPLFFPAGALALLAAAFGCGSSDRPATSDSVETEKTAVVTEPATPNEPGMPRRVCEPRESRECKITYVDEDGQLQCPTNVQICSVDGTAWLPCGAYVYDENHDPQPRP